MALEKLTNCPICNSDKNELHLTVKDYTVSQNKFDIVKCKSCDFLFTNPRPTVESIGAYYKSDNYISHTNKSNSPINLVYKLARTQTLKWKYNLANKSNPKSLLDYGCGTGHFLNYCAKKEIEGNGFEPDENALALTICLITAFKSKSCVLCGGKYPERAFNGAPNIPGSIYITKEKVMMATTLRLLRLSKTSVPSQPRN